MAANHLFRAFAGDAIMISALNDRSLSGFPLLAVQSNAFRMKRRLAQYV
jgi:hypothetical protein